MSGEMRAGHLCATQVGDGVWIDGVRWWLRSVIHRHDHDTVRLVVCRDGGGQVSVFDLPQTSGVLVENPDTLRGAA